MLRSLLGLGGLITTLAGSACAAMAAPAGDLGAEERDIDNAVCADHLRADTWNPAWAISFSIAAVGSAGYATFAPGDWLDSDARAALYVTAIKATAGAIAKLVDPLAIDAEGTCHDSHPASARARQALLVEAARRERRAVLPSFFGGLVLNTAGLLYLGYGRHAWKDAWISFGVGTGVAVASTLTAPTQAWLLNRRLDRARHIVAVPILGRGSLGMAMATTW